MYPLARSGYDDMSKPRIASRSSSFSSEVSSPSLSVGYDDMALKLHTMSLNELCNDLIHKVGSA